STARIRGCLIYGKASRVIARTRRQRRCTTLRHQLSAIGGAVPAEQANLSEGSAGSPRLNPRNQADAEPNPQHRFRVSSGWGLSAAPRRAAVRCLYLGDQIASRIPVYPDRKSLFL